MKVIGVTGGVGSGKSTLLDRIEDKFAACVLKADDLANELKEPGGSCYGPVIELLGEEILEDAREGAPRRIDNRKMAARIFAEPALLDAVNDIIHPAVRKEILERIESCRQEGKTDYFFLEAALLLEGGYDRIVDEMWYIYADEASRIRRLQEGRGYTPQKSRSIIEKQLNEEQYRQGCDVVIDNSGELEETIRQVERVL